MTRQENKGAVRFSFFRSVGVIRPRPPSVADSQFYRRPHMHLIPLLLSIHSTSGMRDRMLYGTGSNHQQIWAPRRMLLSEAEVDLNRFIDSCHEHCLIHGITELDHVLDRARQQDMIITHKTFTQTRDWTFNSPVDTRRILQEWANEPSLTGAQIVQHVLDPSKWMGNGFKRSWNASSCLDIEGALNATIKGQHVFSGEAWHRIERSKDGITIGVTAGAPKRLYSFRNHSLAMALHGPHMVRHCTLDSMRRGLNEAPWACEPRNQEECGGECKWLNRACHPLKWCGFKDRSMCMARRGVCVWKKTCMRDPTVAA